MEKMIWALLAGIRFCREKPEMKGEGRRMAGLPSGLAVFLEFQAAWRRFKKNFSKALTGGIGFRIFRAQLGR
ncbi:MAG TPA: hypothetical protein P5233_04575 [Candidatus Paceibacterota bacterium]|nr:hypothetical protein [Candidatus Paceibacterota bacterium]